MNEYGVVQLVCRDARLARFLLSHPILDDEQCSGFAMAVVIPKHGTVAWPVVEGALKNE